MKEAIDIIRHRWREVAFILALGIVPAVIGIAIAQVTRPPGRPGDLSFWDMAVAVICIPVAIISAVISLGLFRSIAINAFETKRIASLLSTGNAFFWRAFGLVTLYGVGFMIIAYVCFLFLKLALSFTQYPLGSFSEPVGWAQGLCFTIAAAMIAVPFTVSLTLIVVRDCGVGQSLKGISKVRLAGSNFAALAIAAAILNSLYVFVPVEVAVSTVAKIIQIPYNIVTSLADIFVSVFAVCIVTRQLGWAQRPAEAG